MCVLMRLTHPTISAVKVDWFYMQGCTIAELFFKGKKKPLGMCAGAVAEAWITLICRS